MPNGGFEKWTADGKPAGFGTFGTPRGSKVKIETVTRTRDAHSGDSAVSIKNVEIPIPGGAPAGMPKMAFNGGITSCSEEIDCTLNTGKKAPKGRELESLSFRIAHFDDFFCGYYKANLLGGDEALITVLVRSGATVVGGTTPPPGMQGGSMALGGLPGANQVSLASQSRDEWTFFKIPIARAPGQEKVTPDNGVLTMLIMPPGASINPMGVAIGSEIKLDDLGFCGSPIDLQIRYPAVMGGQILPESEELTIGAQAFPNLDNDDADPMFDHQDTDGVSGGDNELVQLLLQLPREARGEAVLRHVKGPAETFKLWTTDEKKTQFKPGQVLDVPRDFRDTGANLEKLVWVEPLSPTAVGDSLQFEFEFKPRLIGDQKAHQEGRMQTDRVMLTILGISAIEWRGKGAGNIAGNSEHDDAVLTDDPNHFDGGKRVFPGRRMTGGVLSPNLDKVGVVVKLTRPPLQPVEIWLRSFDVDDPFPPPKSPVDPEDEAGDNRGRTIDPAGVFTESQSGLAKVRLEGQEQDVEMQVTMQPGDNFRVAGFVDRKHIERLENDDRKFGSKTAGQMIVDPKILDATKDPRASELRDSFGYASKTLTVWRYFYTEIDKMAPIENLRVRGEIRSITRAGGKSVIEINRNLSKIHPVDQSTDGVADSYRGGTFEAGGVAAIIDGNTALSPLGPVDEVLFNAYDTVTVLKEFGDSLVGAEFSMIDNDVKLGYDDGVELVDTPSRTNFTRMAPVFERAYMVPVLGVLPNPNPRAPFVLNTLNDKSDYLRTLFRYDNSQYDDSEDFWVVYILGAYQGLKKEDGDGRSAGGGVEEPTMGEAAGTYGALLYWAAAQDASKDPATGPGSRIMDVLPHEVGHLFGATHGDGELIDRKGEHFSEKTLAKIRKALHP
ncbi:MAG: hypothetical protein IT186_22050 [Acidobacteria bacterium]|nr:hypothetical protein [Acidobacteriota bacterium]